MKESFCLLWFSFFQPLVILFLLRFLVIKHYHLLTLPSLLFHNLYLCTLYVTALCSIVGNLIVAAVMLL